MNTIYKNCSNVYAFTLMTNITNVLTVVTSIDVPVPKKNKISANTNILYLNIVNNKICLPAPKKSIINSAGTVPKYCC